MSKESEVIGKIQDAFEEIDNPDTAQRILVYILRWQASIYDKKAKEFELAFKEFSLKLEHKEMENNLGCDNDKTAMV